MFSESTLAEIRDRLNIVDLVQEYVQLKKSGQGYLGLCPFHGEKTPSFHVHPIKQCFHCFGCQKGGNVFTFLCSIEGLSFPEAVQKLAQRTGVEIKQEERFRREKPKVEIPGAPRLLEALDWAARYFHYNLTSVAEFRPALEYIKKRGVSDKTVAKFRIGVAPKGWNTLLSLMLKRKFSFQELVQAGLVVPKEGSPTQGYDRFRHRLIFPISDKDGRVVGFGGRLLDDEPNQPKYINSSESPLFSKRKILYGMHESQRGIRLRGEAVIVEGYMDVVGLYESGVQNAIATMGTALTEDHLELLRGLTRRVVTVFDPDSAGAEAWRRSVHLFLSGGIFAKDLSLPDHLDPDEFVLKEGAERFYELCEKAPRQVTKLLKEIAALGPLSEEQSARYLAELTPILVASRRLPDRATLWDDISLVLKVSPASLKELSETGAPPTKAVRAPAPRAAQPARKPVAPYPLDREFLEACVRWPEEFLKLPHDAWAGGLKEKRVEAWLERLRVAPNPQEFEAILAELVQKETDSDLLGVGTAALFPKESKAGQDASLFKVIVGRITQRKKEAAIRSLSAQVRLTQRLGDSQEQLRLLEKLKELRST
jgi:DNA primase